MRCAFALALALVLAKAPAQAAEQLPVESTAWFALTPPTASGPAIVTSGWQYVAVQLHNRSDQTLDLTLQLSGVYSFNRNSTVQQVLHVTLSGKATVQRQLYFHIDSRRTFGELTLALRRRNSTVAQQTFRWAFRLGRQTRTIVPPVSELKYPIGRGLGMPWCQLPYWAFPDRHIGYTSVGAAVLWNTPFSQLSAEKRQALIDWVRQGGRVLLSPGSRSWLQTELVRTLLSPIHPTHFTLDTLPLAFRQKGHSLDVTKLDGIRIQTARQIDSMADKNSPHPVMVLASHGQGLVGYLPFDLSKAPFRSHLWTTWLLRTKLLPRLGLPAFPPLSAGPGRSSNPPTLTWPSQPITPPSELIRTLNIARDRMPRVQTTILLLLLYLLIIGPVNFYLVRRYDRPMWLIVTTPTIALLSIGVLAIWNLRVKGLTPTARQFSVLIPSTEPGGAVRSTYLGVYSPSAQVYKLELDARASANLFGINAVQPMVRKLRRGASVGPTSLFVDNYGMGYIHLLQPVEHHNPIILRRKRFDPTVELTNGVDLALTKPLLLRIIDRPASARYRRVKRLIAQPIDVDLPRGATIRTTLSKSDRQFDPALLRAHWGADHLHEARFAYRLTSAILSHARSTGPWIVALAHNDIRPELDTQRTIKPGVTTTRQWRLVIGPIKLVQQ